MSSPADVGLLSPVSAGTSAEELTSDARLVAAMAGFESALLRALGEHRIAPSFELPPLQVDVRRLALDAVPHGNPTIPLVQALRATVPSEHAGWVHFGATSQDAVDTAVMQVASAVARRIEEDLTAVGSVLATLADAARHVPCVARTLSQQALPTTLGLRAGVWLAGVHDAVRMVRSCTTLPVSLGGPVGSAAAYGAAGPAVVETVAGLLGMRAPVAAWHTRRTPVVGLAGALTVTGAACAKIAHDLLVMTQTEVGEAREGTAGSSSAMPHKANPVHSLLIDSAARQLPALTSVLGGAAAPEQERPAGAWHAEWQPLRTMLRLAGGAAEHTVVLVQGWAFDHDAMRRNLDHLVVRLGQDAAWVDEQTAHVDVWIDRVLTQHQEVFP
ncbi:MAG: lyase family protein [Nocardioidaceae bacterium]